MKKINILLVCAGKGTRFKESGYDTPKPLLFVNGKPMYQAVLDNTLEKLFTYRSYDFNIKIISRPEYKIDEHEYTQRENIEVINIGKHNGALEAAYIGASLIQGDNRDNPVLVLNCDQLLINDVYNKIVFNNLLDRITGKDKNDAILIHFTEIARSGNFGYSIVEGGEVVKIFEKQAVTGLAHTGHYIYSSVESFQKNAEDVFGDKIMVNSEYFISPTIDYVNSTLYYGVKSFVCLGNPEYYEKYLQHNKG